MFWPFNKDSTDLLIYDDVFPSSLSPFRYAEYMTYLQHFKEIRILCSGKSLRFFPSSPNIGVLLKQFWLNFPQYKNKVLLLRSLKKVTTKLIYVTFLNNALVARLLFLKTPFVLQIYPGGGLQFYNPDLDIRMKHLFYSPYCKKIIVTQHYVYRYLLEHFLCPPEKIVFIWGVVTPPSILETMVTNKKHFGIDKDTLDICFTAHKYMPQGRDKGYDLFISTAKNLAAKYDFVRFHVVGGFSSKDIDVRSLKNKITFYGIQKGNWFNSFYRDIDIFLSPNRPFVLSTGGFDGFPTACATEASLREVALFATDELKENMSYFQNGKDFILIRPNVDDIVQKIEFLIIHPQKLKEIGEFGAKKIKQLYSFNAQMGPRIQLLEKELAKLL